MLSSLVLLLAAGPLADPRTPPPAAPSAPGLDRSAEAARCRNAALSRAGDGAGVRPGRDGAAVLARRAPPLSGDLMFRSDDPVSLTLLLERHVGGCSVPISYDLTVPGARLPSFPARAD